MFYLKRIKFETSTFRNDVYFFVARLRVANTRIIRLNIFYDNFAYFFFLLNKNYSGYLKLTKTLKQIRNGLHRSNSKYNATLGAEKQTRECTYNKSSLKILL